MKSEYMKLREVWKEEEDRGFQGWDFSRLNGRMSEEELPWDYKAAVLAYKNEDTVMLDMGTGGGEFLLSLEPTPGKTFATENYVPNYELCAAKLPLYGIEVRRAESDEALPFGDAMFDLVINRHEAFSAEEVYRILKPGGVFITQQVGGMNNRELSRFLLGVDAAAEDTEFHADLVSEQLEQAGFEVLKRQECFPILKFYDIGALVYFAKIIEWEFPGFSVDRCFAKLCMLQEQLESDGFILGKEHRFFILARKSTTHDL